tara:strand:+ start:6374 stop:7609 length:1236 start_codon:yes stop_codon:yes gene_type:complete
MIKTLNNCQFSKKKDLVEIINLGKFVLVNNFQKNKKKSLSQRKYPLKLMFSKKSKLIQINCILPKEILFPKRYPYTSSTTKILRDNFVQLSKQIKKKIKLNSKDVVMDIGCNDGSLLKNFLGTSCTLGVSPENIIKNAKKLGINTIQAYFDNKTVKKIKKKFDKIKVITATNSFAHINHANELVGNIKKLLDNDGIFISESHYADAVINGMQYDSIYHEHLRYYSLSSLNFILKKHKLKIFDCDMIKPHGGSIRVFCSHEKNKKFKVNKKKINKIFQYEKKNLNISSFKQYKEKVEKNRDDISKLLKKLHNMKKTVYGLGAPSRASTLINYNSLNSKLIQNVLEVSGSHKINKYMPGTDIKVIHENSGLYKKPDYLFVFSWHIAKELIKSLKKKGFKGKFIIPLPRMKIAK